MEGSFQRTTFGEFGPVIFLIHYETGAIADELLSVMLNNLYLLRKDEKEIY